MNQRISFGKFALFMLGFAGLLLISDVTIRAQSRLPRPELIFVEKKDYVLNGAEWTLYRLDVANKQDYPPEMFDPAPDLPACGRNKNSSRTWIDIFAQNGRRLYGFCALKSPDELNQLAFQVPKGTSLDYVYVVIHDRKLNKKWKSNLVSTSEP